ncbi:hypothetical protein FOMPIDRAFT_1024806 [Fomitopsis schrenkii]|uniref:F-box domain-containing protein n=1 Tax=Fomitopsis schrenkii TaxID=2126942 RepID=S8DYH9_FOMSC|nr:hypothetical protein FOMPIDRAFT_1024806 [Fomitopsis schrenkii]
MSLLQDVLRTQTIDQTFSNLNLTERLQTQRADPESDEEIIGVVTAPGTRPASRAPSRPTSRPSSPGPRGAARRPYHAALSSMSTSRDPLRALPTDISQRIFSRLSTRDLARCSRVSKKWNRSQTLNYVWFQHYRKENFHDDGLPPGKWTKRESKQNWRTTYLQTVASRDSDKLGPVYHSYSGRSTPLSSGAQTPREVREDRWRQEVDARPSKVEMREMYKELKGRKAKGKFNVGAGSGMRDRGGWADGAEEL